MLYRTNSTRGINPFAEPFSFALFMSMPMALRSGRWRVVGRGIIGWWIVRWRLLGRISEGRDVHTITVFSALQLVFNGQHAYEADHQPLPKTCLRVVVVLHFFPVSL